MGHPPAQNAKDKGLGIDGAGAVVLGDGVDGEDALVGVAFHGSFLAFEFDQFSDFEGGGVSDEFEYGLIAVAGNGGTVRGVDDAALDRWVAGGEIDDGDGCAGGDDNDGHDYLDANGVKAFRSCGWGLGGKSKEESEYKERSNQLRYQGYLRRKSYRFWFPECYAGLSLAAMDICSGWREGSKGTEGPRCCGT